MKRRSLKLDADVEELVEAVEMAFGVTFEPGEILEDSTVDDLCLALQSQLGGQQSDKCLTSIVFWRLRRACAQLFDSQKSSIQPWTSIDLVLPEKKRRTAWRSLSVTSGLRLPGLECTSFFSTIGFVVSGAVAAIPLVALGGGWWLALLIILWPTVNTVLSDVLKPFADLLPYHTGTFGDLARLTMGLNYGKLSGELGHARTSDIAEAVRYVLADLIDIDPQTLVGANPRLIDVVLEEGVF